MYSNITAVNLMTRILSKCFCKLPNSAIPKFELLVKKRRTSPLLYVPMAKCLLPNLPSAHLSAVKMKVSQFEKPFPSILAI